MIQHRINDIVETENGEIWLATQGAGVIRKSGGKWRQLTHKNGFLSDVIRDIFIDREGNIWFSQLGGLSKLTKTYQAFTHYTAKTQSDGHSDLPGNEVLSVMARNSADTDQFWVGTNRGLVMIGSSEIKQFPQTKNQPIQAICKHRNKLWLGTEQGLLQLDLDQQKIISFKSIGPIFACLVQPQTQGQTVIWLAGNNRIFAVVNDKWLVFEQASGLPLSPFYSFAVDDKNLLWIASGKHGLYRSAIPLRSQDLPFNQATHEPHPITDLIFEPVWNRQQGAPTDVMRALLRLHGNIWVGTSHGLAVFNSPTYTMPTMITRQHGLRDNNIFSLAHSSISGNIWVGTNKGLAEIDPNSSQVIRTVTKPDGLIDNEIWAWQSLTTNRKGAVFFGTPKGLTVYQPNLHATNTVEPKLHLRNFFLQQDNSGNNALSVTYAALSFANERQLRFKTRLTGFDTDWSPLNKEIKHRYTNLPAYFFPKHYSFEIIAANNDGVITQTPLSYHFQVNPAWWLRWWALLLFLILAIASTWSFSVYYSRKLEKRNQELATLNSRLTEVDRLKDDFLANTSHELRTPLNGIIGISESLIDGAAGTITPLMHENLAMITASGQRLANLINDILDFSQLSQDELVLKYDAIDMRRLTAMVIYLSQHLIADKDLILKNYILADIPLINGDEHRLQQVIHNLIGNAIKFTPAGSVTVFALIQGNFLEIAITDTGIGIAQDQLESIFQSFNQADSCSAREFGGTGLGLSITKHIIELHGGQIKVESEINQGSRFIFTLPISTQAMSTAINAEP